LCSCTHRIQSVETALKSCQKELEDEKAKLNELKEHFKYNLKLINDRDAELQRYDALFLGNSATGSMFLAEQLRMKCIEQNAINVLLFELADR